MKAVFAPWRLEFILGKKEKGCVFCTRWKRKRDRKDLILFRGKLSFVILNKYPYNNGHLMVIPYRHVSKLSDLKDNELLEIMALMRRATVVLEKACHAQGINVGLNQGQVAGAGIKDHVHFHVVPRWLADSNFWPVISATKSMPEHLMTTYDRLKKAWK